MDIWIIRDGEKIGPLHDFEIRRKIGEGELPATTPAWHEGLDSWKPLVEIEIFTREFALAAAPRESEREPEAEAIPPRTGPPPLPVKTCYIRRFWARWFDLTLYSGLWWIGMWAARQDIEAALLNPWVMFFQFMPWFAVETLLIHYWGTTPGKWLLGLEVANNDGSRLALGPSTGRAVRVLFAGIGFGWGILAVLCQALSLIAARRLGAPLWDHLGGHQVVARPLNPLRVIALVFLFFGAIQLQVIVVSPYVFEMAGKSFPSIKERYEKSPPYHLPKRS